MTMAASSEISEEMQMTLITLPQPSPSCFQNIAA